MEGLEVRVTRPRQVRYQAALRPDRCCSLYSKTLLDSPHSATRTKTTQNRPYRRKTPSVGPLRVKTPAALIRLPGQLLQRLPFHLQLHLRILLEHLGVSLPEQLSHPLVRHTAGAQARGVRGTEVVDAVVWRLRSPQSGMPHCLQSLLVSARVLIARKQPRTRSCESQLIPKRLHDDFGQRNLGDPVCGL